MIKIKNQITNDAFNTKTIDQVLNVFPVIALFVFYSFGGSGTGCGFSFFISVHFCFLFSFLFISINVIYSNKLDKL